MSVALDSIAVDGRYWAVAEHPFLTAAIDMAAAVRRAELCAVALSDYRAVYAATATPKNPEGQGLVAAVGTLQAQTAHSLAGGETRARGARKREKYLRPYALKIEAKHGASATAARKTDWLFLRCGENKWQGWPGGPENSPAHATVRKKWAKLIAP